MILIKKLNSDKQVCLPLLTWMIWTVLQLQTENEPRYDKTNKMTVHPGKTQISLGIRPVWSESSLCTQWIAKDPSFLHADSEDSDQTGRIQAEASVWPSASHFQHWLQGFEF